MGTLDAIYAAILANPRDDLARLMYADALEEAGNETYANFIRMMIDGNDAVAAACLWSDPSAIIPVIRPLTSVCFDDGVVTASSKWIQIDFRRGLPKTLVVPPGELLPDEQQLIACGTVTYVAVRRGHGASKSSREIIAEARERHPVPKPYHGL